MKRIVALSILLLAGIGLLQAQKFAFVDTEYILNNIPAYKAAQDQLDKYSAELQKEVENKYTEIDEMYKKFQAEKVLLSDEMKSKREEEIITKEKEVKDLQKKYFGNDGTLFKKREELVKPIQDEIYNAVKEIAAEGGFAAIYDTSADASILFSDPKYDKSDQVLEKLGYKN
ncbi:MAG: OmpH family outer membrane protein [Bacteroidales bacterium]|jgi:outer membrane protein